MRTKNLLQKSNQHFAEKYKRNVGLSHSKSNESGDVDYICNKRIIRSCYLFIYIYRLDQI